MIIFSSVTKQFGDTTPALDNVSFSVDEGELAIITGPSGSGKTSLMRLLTREYTPSEGDITFHDVPLASIRTSKLHEHRRKIGVVFQDYKLLHDLNVWENIALALSIIGASPTETEKRVTDLLKLVGLVDKAFLFPSQLSGGEAQRVSIARALSTAPKVIFADEPTGNLDPETSKNIITLLEKINNLGTTVLVTTHDPVVLDVLAKARQLKLNKGKLVHDSQPSKTNKSAPSKEKKEEEHVAVEVTGLDDEPTQEKKHQEKPKTEKKKQDVQEDAEKKENTQKARSRPRIKLGLPSFMLSPFKNKKPEKSDKNDSDSVKEETTDQDKKDTKDE